MSRLRQLFAQNYPNSGNISSEFESVIRYLNAAELGNKTIAELLAQLFDQDGNFAGPIELRLDTNSGLEYRIGAYSSPDAGWHQMASLDDIRGPAGENLGTIEGPFFYNRQDFTATAGQTQFAYTIDATVDDVVVYKNGLLLAASEYTVDDLNNRITLDSGASLNDLISIYSIRTSSVSGYVRTDLTSSAGQAVFPFVHTDDQKLMVFRNGILQREGGAYDYVQSALSSTVTFTTALPANDLVTIMTVENAAVRNVGGLLMEDEYATDGLLRWDKINVADGAIPQSKVQDLVASLIAKAKLTVSGVTPTGSAQGDLWLDTSQIPNTLKFYDGSNWLNTNPGSSLPSFITSNANQYVRVNALGTGLEYGNIDFSALVPKTYIGAANGVAALDSAGKLPTSQLPDIFAIGTMGYQNLGTVNNGTVLVQRIYGVKMRLTGWGYKLAAGTCTIQISVDGVTVGATQAVTSAAGQNNFGTIIEIDATTATRRIEITITSATSASGLEVGLATQNLSS
jgi:hypothetical protein